MKPKSRKSGTVSKGKKKVAAKRVRWVLLEDFGRPVVRDDVPDDVVRDVVAAIVR